MREAGPLRIAVVDDDVWVRTGRVAALEAATADAVVVADCDHRRATSGEVDWDRVDVALVDAWDGDRDWDRFPGVAVVESIRAARSPDELLVIVITGQVANDLLRLRMAEAGADFFYTHGELRTIEDLLAAITRPDRARRPRTVERNTLAGLGVSGSARFNAALHDIEQRGQQAAFAPGLSQKSLPYGRRTLITTRRRLASLARIAPSRPGDGNRLPEWRQVVRLVNLARGVDDTDDG